MKGIIRLKNIVLCRSELIYNCVTAVYSFYQKEWQLHYPVFRVQEHGGEPIIPFSCVLERNLSDMPPDEAAKYCEENKLQRLVYLNFV